MRSVVDELIRVCCESQPTTSGFPHIPILRIDCLSEQLIKVSDYIERTGCPEDVIALLQSLKIRLKQYVCIDESNESFIALREELSKIRRDNPHQFNAYFRRNIRKCKECWDGCTEKHRAVKAYLATFLLIYAAEPKPDIDTPLLGALLPDMFRS